MAKLVYGFQQSLDGYVDHMKLGPPSAELFHHFIGIARAQAGFLYGRVTYKIMRYWEQDQPDWDAQDREFAAVWCGKPKWVVSRSLHSAGPNATLLKGDLDTAIPELKHKIDGEIGLGGTRLAASLSHLGLVDEYRLYLRPVVLGGGTPFFAAPRPPLRLLSSGVVGEGMFQLTYVPA